MCIVRDSCKRVMITNTNEFHSHYGSNAQHVPDLQLDEVGKQPNFKYFVLEESDELRQYVAPLEIVFLRLSMSLQC